MVSINDLRGIQLRFFYYKRMNYYAEFNSLSKVRITQTQISIGGKLWPILLQWSHIDIDCDNFITLALVLCKLVIVRNQIGLHAFTGEELNYGCCNYIDLNIIGNETLFWF